MSMIVHGVSEVSKRIKSLLEHDIALHSFLMEGEISNFRSSKHWYFSLKDENSSINCAIWASSIPHISFQPKNGDKVIAKCSLSYYGPSNAVTITISAMKLQGIGDLLLKLEELKKKLSKEGLFALQHKQKLPMYPSRIGIITGKDTAGKADMIRTLNLRWPKAEQVFYECPVQGNSSIPFIIKAIEKADADQNDVLILARGGGSFEDLYIFNDEQIVRTIYNCKTPLVTGVGHETDTTLVDYVADLRANTPTGAAEAVSPNQYEIRQYLRQLQNKFIKYIEHMMSLNHQSLQKNKQFAYFQNPELILRDQSYQLDQYYLLLLKQKEFLLQKKALFQDEYHRFEKIMHLKIYNYQNTLQNIKQYLNTNIKEVNMQKSNQINEYQTLLLNDIETYYIEKKHHFSNELQLLDAYSPLKVLKRGYTIMQINGNIIKQINDVQENDLVHLRLSDGFLKARIIAKEKKEWQN